MFPISCSLLNAPSKPPHVAAPPVANAQTLRFDKKSCSAFFTRPPVDADERVRKTRREDGLLERARADETPRSRMGIDASLRAAVESILTRKE